MTAGSGPLPVDVHRTGLGTLSLPPAVAWSECPLGLEGSVPVPAPPASPLPGPGAHCTRSSFSWGAGSHPAGWSRGGAFNPFGVRSVARWASSSLQAGCFWVSPLPAETPLSNTFQRLSVLSCVLPCFLSFWSRGVAALAASGGLGRGWLSGCMQPAILQPAPCFINFPGESSVAILKWEAFVSRDIRSVLQSWHSAQSRGIGRWFCT